MKKLAIKSINNYGDPLYTENFNEDSKTYDYPKDEDIWAIFCPSEKIKSYYPNCKVRTYNNTEYLLSSKAKEFIPDDLKVYGSCAVIDFYYQSKKYFIMVIDNKNYIQNPQGSANENEDSLDCIIREIYEELKIIIYKEQCIEVGYWKHIIRNKLINTNLDGLTTLYHISVTFEQVEHLIPKRKLNDFEIIDVNNYEFKLSETEYVVFSTYEKVLDFEEYFGLLKKNGKMTNHSWNGHHRQAILSLFGIKKYKTSYLNDFMVSKMFDV